MITVFLFLLLVCVSVTLNGPNIEFAFFKIFYFILNWYFGLAFYILFLKFTHYLNSHLYCDFFCVLLLLLCIQQNTLNITKIFVFHISKMNIFILVINSKQHFQQNTKSILYSTISLDYQLAHSIFLYVNW